MEAESTRCEGEVIWIRTTCTKVSSGRPTERRGGAYSSDPLGVLLKEPLERLQLLQDTSDTVQAITADDDLAVAIASLDLLHVLLHRLCHNGVPHLFDIHSDRIHFHRTVGTISIDADRITLRILGFREAQYPLAAGHEMLFVGQRLEGDHVGRQHALEERLSPRKDSENLGGRPRRVNEEADVSIPTEALSQNLRQNQEVIVVNPNDISGLVHFQDGISEGIVEPQVVSPPPLLFQSRAFRRREGLRNNVMECGPENYDSLAKATPSRIGRSYLSRRTPAIYHRPTTTLRSPRRRARPA